MATMDEMARVALVGIGATLVMDLWTALLKRMGAPTLNYALLGRWAGHLGQGQFAHANIGKAAPLRGELPLGWFIHYGVGIAFAAVMVGLCGTDWLRNPTWEAALAMGVATVVFPLLVMQPAFGAGFAGSRTPTPFRNCLRTLLTHAVFGCGLYLSETALSRISP